VFVKEDTFAHIFLKYYEQMKMNFYTTLAKVSLFFVFSTWNTLITASPLTDTLKTNRNVDVPQIVKDTVATPPKRHSELSFSTEYVDQVFYLGRNYGVEQSSTAGTVGLKHPSGIWATNTHYYMSSIGYSEHRLFAKSEYTLGMDYDYRRWWKTTVAYTNSYFYADNQQRLQDPYDSWWTFFNSIEVGGFTFSPQIYALLGKQQRKKILQTGIGIAKNFEKRFGRDKRSTLSFEPNVLIMSATYDVTGELSPTWFKNKALKWVANELALPITYQYGLKWQNQAYGIFKFNATWHAVQALNPFWDDGARNKPFGFWTAKIKYIFEI
jgi:hypothetical protein